MTVDLIGEYPILSRLSSEELDEALCQGGLSLAFARARIRQATQPRKPGRPTTVRHNRKVIERRGRKAERQIHPTSTNTQLAQHARMWRDTFKCNARHAVRQIFTALGIEPTARDVHNVAKLLSELTGLEHDKQIRREAAKKTESYSPAGADFSLMGQLSRANTKGR